jgi:hypothetical protein
MGTLTKSAGAGWPVPPSRQSWCSSCPAGWASTQVDALNCEMCGPGRYAALPRSPECTACPNGTYASSWGSTHCNHCIIGTYAPRPVRAPSTSSYFSANRESTVRSCRVDTGTLKYQYANSVWFHADLLMRSLSSVSIAKSDYQ